MGSLLVSLTKCHRLNPTLTCKGFHATTPSEFAEAFHQALSLSPADALAMRQRARESSWRFSEKVFSDAWLGHLANLVELTGKGASVERDKVK